jgi:hypothetical protein
MSKTNTHESELLLLEFNNTDAAGLGDAGGLRGSVGAGSLYVSLHTATPDEGGNQATNETAYTGYVRIGVARSGAGWVVTGSSVSPAANIDFAECTASPGAPLTHFGVGDAASGAGKLRRYGTLTPNIVMATSIIPRIKTTSTITED